MKISIGKSQSYGDAFSIVAMLWEARDETDFPVPAPNIPYAYQNLMEMISSGTVWVAKTDEDKLIGVAIASPQRLWHVQEPHFLQTEEFYVEPAYRKGGIAARLLEKVTEAADEMGVPLVVSITSGGMAELKDRFVAQQGLTYLGGNLLHQPASKEETVVEAAE